MDPTKLLKELERAVSGQETRRVTLEKVAGLIKKAAITAESDSMTSITL